MQVTTNLDLMNDKSFLHKPLEHFSFHYLQSNSKIFILGSFDSLKYRLLESLYKYVQSTFQEDCKRILYFEDISIPFDENLCARIQEECQVSDKKFGLFLDACDPWMQSSNTIRKLMHNKDSFFAACCIGIPNKYQFQGLYFDWVILLGDLSSSKLFSIWHNYIGWSPPLDQFIYIYKLYTQDPTQCLIIHIQKLKEVSLRSHFVWEDILSCFRKQSIKQSHFM